MKMHKFLLPHMIIGTIILFLPYSVFAARIYFIVVQNPVSQNGATIEVRIDPEAQKLNTVDGIINFEGAGTDKLTVETETDGSILTLWPVLPQYFSSDKVIRFTGGVPNGFDHSGLLFRMHFLSSVSSDVRISWIGGAAYLNDGRGTAEAVSSRSLTVHIDQDSLSVSSAPTSSNKLLEFPSGFNQWKNVMISVGFIILLVLMLACIYGHKKIFKK